VAAVEAVDADDPAAPGAVLAITADHGNADWMRDADGRPVTAHSLNPVPLVLVGRVARGLRLADGVLADVAPTLLELAGLPRWTEMTGRSLVLW
jgi:2,3-bisphosphoglycerate-independent phosphoglycerate mutase